MNLASCLKWLIKDLFQLKGVHGWCFGMYYDVQLVTK